MTAQDQNAAESSATPVARQTAKLAQDGFKALDDLIVENERLADELTAQSAEFQSRLTQIGTERDLAAQEGTKIRAAYEELTRAFTAMRNERDRYCRAAISMKAAMHSCGHAFMQAIQSADRDDYGERPTTPERHAVDATPAPTFLRQVLNR